jgi:hypothetical protein
MQGIAPLRSANDLMAKASRAGGDRCGGAAARGRGEPSDGRSPVLAVWRRGGRSQRLAIVCYMVVIGSYMDRPRGERPPGVACWGENEALGPVPARAHEGWFLV